MPKNAALSKPPGKPPGPALKAQLRGFVQRVWQTVNWVRGRIDLDPGVEMNRAQRILASNLRIIFLVFRPEVYKRIELHAQALTMKTLLGLVPLLAVIFAIFKSAIFAGFGGIEEINRKLEDFILSNLTGADDVRGVVSEYLGQFVNNIHAGKLGTVSVLILIITVMSLLSHIENSFNTIFGATSMRPAGVRLLAYWAVLTIGPLLLMLSFALSATFQSSVGDSWLEQLGWLGSAGLKILPLGVTWFAFMTLYLVVPSTRVRFLPAFLAAVVAGSLWNIAKYGFTWYVKNNVTTRDIYGSLAAFPMFILWMYVAWLLVLFGAQLCFAFQHAATYRREDVHEQHSHRAVEVAVCRLFLEVVRDFLHGTSSTQPDEASARLALPGKLQERVVTALLEGGFVREVGDGGLVPAIDPEKVTVETLLHHVRAEVGTTPILTHDEPRKFLDDLFGKLEAERSRQAGAVNFRELAARFPLTPEPQA